jgi:hypothetical protein
MANGGGPDKKKSSRKGRGDYRTQAVISLAAIRNKKLIDKLKDY